MKKVFFIATFLTVGIISQAQIKFGVKAGANLYKFNGDDADMSDDVKAKYRIGIAGGGFVNIPITPMFSVQPEILYSMEGNKYAEGGEKLVYKTDYINIPVMLQYNNASGFYAETGPQIGFLASAKASNGDDSEDIKDSFKSTNFSWALGAGYKLPSGLGFGARYNFGLGNVIDSDDADVKISGFHVGIFYTLGGKK